jgi:antitoxin (DNA-binding transcriptional repressor) of toxin-antitoxin stability system
MKRVTVRELRTKTSDIVKEVASGEVFIIEKEGVAVAEIRPIAQLLPSQKLTDREKFLRQMPPAKTDRSGLI